MVIKPREEFKNAEEVFDWWTSGMSKRKYFGMKEQETIDFD